MYILEIPTHGVLLSRTRKYDYGDKVASLTTISTPHHGSEIADLLYSRKGIHSKIVRLRLMGFGKLYGDLHPDIYKLNYELTTVKMKEFNKNVTMDNKVYYQSIYSTMNDPLDDIILSRSYNYIKKEAGDNDGLVSECSARWSDHIIKIEGGISHEQIIDQRGKNIAGINIHGLYLKMVSDLSAMGF